MKKKIIILWLLVFAYTSSAQELANIPATFLNIGFGARALGMGGAYYAAADDVHSIVWNPAGLSALERWQMTFSYTKQFGLVPYYFLASASPLKSTWAHGQAFIVSGDEVMQEIRAIGGVAKYFENYVPGLRLGLTLDLRHASYGRNNNGAAGSINGEAFGFAISVGAQYEILDHITLAIVINNFLNTMSWNTSGRGSYSEGVPLTFHGGMALKGFKDFVIDVDFEKSLHDDTPDKVFMGVERPCLNYFVLRGGFSGNLGYYEYTYQYAIGAGLRNVMGDHFFLNFTYLFNEFRNCYRMSVVYQK